MFVWLRLTLQLSHNSEDEENCGNVFRQHFTRAGIVINIDITKGNDAGGGSFQLNPKEMQDFCNVMILKLY